MTPDLEEACALGERPIGRMICVEVNSHPLSIK